MITRTILVNSSYYRTVNGVIGKIHNQRNLVLEYSDGIGEWEWQRVSKVKRREREIVGNYRNGDERVPATSGALRAGQYMHFVQTNTKPKKTQNDGGRRVWGDDDDV